MGFPTREEIEAQQRAALQRLVAALIPANSFYARKLAEAGLTADFPDLPTFFARMPFTQKSELVEDQRVHPPYGTNLTFPLERYTRFSQTS